jgi:DNA sulfur modification protein DndD
MDIDYINMKNFRQYANVKIDFARLHPMNFTVIQGPNGAGKTNLLNAITWCLFGKELHIDTKYLGLPLVNTTTLDESKEGDLFEVKVEIQFVQSTGKRIVVTRTISYKKHNGKPVEIPTVHPQPCIMREAGRDWVGPIYGSDAQYIINNLIPQSIEEYFFFDGERMNDYFKKSTGTDIRKAVFKISQLELLETLIEHLTLRRTNFLREYKDLSSEAQKIKEFLEIQNRSLDTDKEELQKLSDEKDEAERMVLLYSNKLKNSSVERIESLERQRDDLRDDVSRIQTQIEDIETEELKLLHRYMPIVFTHEALLKTKKLIDTTRAAGLIPPLYEAIFIQNLLNKGRCICGSDITEKDEYSSDRRKKVEAFLETSKLSDISTDLIETNVRIHEMLGQLPNFPDGIISCGKRSKNLQAMKTAKNETLKKIAQEIEQSNIENIREWEQERSKYEEQKENFAGKIVLIRDRMARRQNIIRANNIELNRELRKERKHNSLLQTLTFCDEGIKAAQEIKNRIMKEVKDDIEKRTSQQFTALIWKKGTFKGVLIDDEYNISVPDVSGREAFGTLSAGERQVCALSFMAALNSVSGFEVPIVIDTPLARISSEPRRNIAKNLPDYLEGTQVTLLVTAEEYTPEVEAALAERVGKTYRINAFEKERGNLAEVRLMK